MKNHKIYVVTLSSSYTQRPVIEVTIQKSCLSLWPGGVVKMLNQVNMKITLNKFSRKSGYVYAGKLDSSLMPYKEGIKKQHIPIMRVQNRGDIGINFYDLILNNGF
jgi:hypothetical protein